MDKGSDTTDQKEKNNDITDKELFSSLLAEVENKEGWEGVLGEESIHLFNVDVDADI